MAKRRDTRNQPHTPDSQGRRPVKSATVTPPALSRAWIAGLAVACIVVLVAGLTAYRPTVTALVSNSSAERIVITDDLNDNGAKLLRQATVEGDVVATEFGLALRPGRHFSATWKGVKQPGELPFVRLWMLEGATADNRIQFRSGQSQETLRATRDLRAVVVRPKVMDAGATDFAITISSALPAEAPEPLIVLDRVEIGLRVFADGEVQAGAWSAFPASFVPLLAFLLVSLVPRLRRGAPHVGIAAGLVVAEAAMLYPGALVWVGWVFIGVSCVLFAALSVRGAGDAWTRRFAFGLAAAALLGIALSHRWHWFVAYGGTRLLPDAETYQALARAMRWPYATGSREPFLPWVIWLVSTLTAWTPTTVRFATVAVSMVEGVALLLLARRFVSRPAALVALLCFAGSPVLAHSAALGLREEALPAAWLLFLLGCSLSRAHPSDRRFQVIAVVAGVCAVLTRLNALLFVVPVYAGFAWLGGWGWRRVAAAGAILFVAVVPHLVNNKICSGDAFDSTNIYGSWWRNFEFAGKPGFVTREEFAANGNAGERITTSQYVFGMHTPREIATDTVAGLWKMTFGEPTREMLLRVGWGIRVDDMWNPILFIRGPTIADRVLFVCYLIGLLFVFRRRDGWSLPASMFLFMLPIAFVAGRFNFPDPRLMMNHTPVMLVLVGVGAEVAGLQARRLVALRKMWKPTIADSTT